ncbi:MAG: YajQ family cyclic di-GMP-binding protein, partial [Alphaproteobacteria bacterium]|nr:YajQ family cyclic di-GMP-binding protein [Alphaproteobacteria bacterium]
MPSFDIVSRADLAEVDNALNGMRREITQRFDFKDSNCTIDRDDESLTIIADDDMKLRQMHELLKVHLTRRGVPAGVMEYLTPEQASGGTLRQKVTIRQGVSADMAKQIVKAIKAKKLKVQAAIQGEEVRISGKKRDDLQ